MTDAERRVRRIIAEVACIDKSEITAETTLSESGIDSLDLHDIELHIEEEFGFTEDAFNVKLDDSVTEIAAKVERVLSTPRE